MEDAVLYSAVGAQQARWLLLDKRGEPEGAEQQGDLTAAAAALAGRRFVWVLHGEDVWLGERTMPARSRRQLAQALPYALEDELACEVEDLLFAHVPLGELTGVAVIDRRLLEAGVDQLRQAGLGPLRIIPDVLLLPLPDDGWYLKQDGVRILCRMGRVSGFVCERENLPLLLAAALAEAGEGAPSRLLVEGDIELGADQTGLPGIEQVPVAPTLQRLAQGLPQAPRIDFTRLLDSHAGETQVKRRRWLIAAGLALLAFGLLLAQRGLELQRTKTYNAELSQAIEQIYRGAFPQAVRVEDARVQMEQKLRSLQAGNRAGGGFLAELAAVAPAIQGEPGLQMEGIEYRDRLLLLRLHGRDLQQLDRLKQAIEAQGVGEVEIKSVNQVEKGVTAQLKIRGRQT